MSRTRSRSPTSSFLQDGGRKAQAPGLVERPPSPRARPTSPGTGRKFCATPSVTTKPSFPRVKSSPTRARSPQSPSAKSPSRERSKSPSRRSRSPVRPQAEIPRILKPSREVKVKPLSPRARPTSPGTGRKFCATPPVTATPSFPRVKSSPTRARSPKSPSSNSPSRGRSKSPSRRSRSPVRPQAEIPQIIKPSREVKARPLSPRASPTSPGTYPKILVTPPTTAKPVSPSIMLAPTHVKRPQSPSAKSAPRVRSKSPSRRSQSPVRTLAEIQQILQFSHKELAPFKSEQLDVSMVTKEEESPLAPPPLQASSTVELGPLAVPQVESKLKKSAEDLNEIVAEKNVQALAKQGDVEANMKAIGDPVAETANADVPVSVCEVEITMSESLQSCDLNGVAVMNTMHDEGQVERKKEDTGEDKKEKQKEEKI